MAQSKPSSPPELFSALSRRELLQRMGTGLGTLGLAGILAQEGLLADTAAPAAAANPLAQIDDKSDIPPRVQMQLKQAEATIQHLQQQLQAAGLEIKTRAGIEQMKQKEETKRELMRQTTKAHDIVLRDQTAERDTAVKAHVQAQDTALEVQGRLTVEEIRAHLALLLAKMDPHEAGDQATEEAVENAV